MSKLIPIVRTLLLILSASIMIFALSAAYHVAVGYEAPNRGIHGARPLTVADMARPPISAVAVTQCNLLIAAYFTLVDGSFAKIDVKHHEGIDYDEAMRWGDKAIAGAERVEAACDDDNKYQRTSNVLVNKPEALESIEKLPDSIHFTRVYSCHKLLAVILHDPTGLRILRLSEQTPAYVAELTGLLAQIKEQHGPVADFDIETSCVRT